MYEGYFIFLAVIAVSLLLLGASNVVAMLLVYYAIRSLSVMQITLIELIERSVIIPSTSSLVNENVVSVSNRSRYNHDVSWD